MILQIFSPSSFLTRSIVPGDFVARASYAFLHRSSRVAKRSYFTPTIEFSGENSNKLVKERPCTLILTEEPVMFQLGGEASTSDVTDSSNSLKEASSWHESFSKTVPSEYGIAYTKWSFSSADPASFDVALSALKKDFTASRLQQPILVTRGPVLSWLAQFYLESLPLAGLIMVDPLPLNDEKACALYEKYHKNHRTSAGDESASHPEPFYAIYTDYVNYWDHWTLKLESGSVPMMVLSTMISDSARLYDQVKVDDSPLDEDVLSKHATTPDSDAELDELYLWRQFAESTARQHASSEFGLVPAVDIDPFDAKLCSTIICDWIEDKVL
jgi:hypothetical protein